MLINERGLRFKKPSPGIRGNTGRPDHYGDRAVKRRCGSASRKQMAANREFREMGLGQPQGNRPVAKLKLTQSLQWAKTPRSLYRSARRTVRGIYRRGRLTSAEQNLVQHMLRSSGAAPHTDAGSPCSCAASGWLRPAGCCALWETHRKTCLSLAAEEDRDRPAASSQSDRGRRTETPGSLTGNSKEPTVIWLRSRAKKGWIDRLWRERLPPPVSPKGGAPLG